MKMIDLGYCNSIRADAIIAVRVGDTIRPKLFIDYGVGQTISIDCGTDDERDALAQRIIDEIEFEALLTVLEQMAVLDRVTVIDVVCTEVMVDLSQTPEPRD